MPTENRSSNTEMVSVPRERLDALWREIQDSSLRSEDPPHVRFAAALLAQPAEQRQGEPVAWMDPRSPQMHATISNEVKQHNLKFGGAPASAVNGYTIPLYTHADPGEVERLRTALKFYADREHYHFESGNWDTVSGEPLNILWCGDEPDFLEDGSVARAALERQP